MRKSDACPSKYFRAKDLPDGWTLTAEIELARMEKFDDDRKGSVEKMVIFFRRQKSGLVCGPTLWDQLIKATGEEDSDNWKNHVVELFKTTTTFGRDEVPCVRVRKPSAKPAAKKAAPKVVEEEMSYDDAQSDD